jgi:hypothetical protein
MERFGLRNDQWERIKDVLPGREGHVGGMAQDNRLFGGGVESEPHLIGGRAVTQHAVRRYPQQKRPVFPKLSLQPAHGLKMIHHMDEAVAVPSGGF